MRAINAFRCMYNNFGTNTWALLAALYSFLLLVGVGQDANWYLDEFYSYACTCMIDAAGIKEMMGCSQESSDIFGGCSEKGKAVKYEGIVKKENQEKKKVKESKR